MNALGRIVEKRTVRTVAQGARRYVVGRVAPFDQKNEMFRRPVWDPNLLSLGEKFYRSPVAPRNRAGRRLADLALVNASWHLENICAQGVGSGKTGLYAWQWEEIFNYPRVPRGLRIDTADPETVTRELKRAARFFGAALVGVCELDRDWLYASVYSRRKRRALPNDVPAEYRHAVVVAVEMDYGAIGCSPGGPASAATGLGYSKMAFVAGLLAHHIRGLGFKAIACGNDTGCSIPMAIDAGLGELARNGLLVTPQYGPRVRLAKVLTDMPLLPDRPIAFGVWEFCRICKKCARQCPSQSISHAEPTDRPNDISNRPGVLRWPIKAETCLAFWARRGHDCSNCIRSCPFNKPDGMLHDLVRWGISRLPRLHRLFLWGDDIFGYGRRQDPGRFWTGQRKGAPRAPENGSALTH